MTLVHLVVRLSVFVVDLQQPFRNIPVKVMQKVYFVKVAIELHQNLFP